MDSSISVEPIPTRSKVLKLTALELIYTLWWQMCSLTEALKRVKWHLLNTGKHVVVTCWGAMIGPISLPHVCCWFGSLWLCSGLSSLYALHVPMGSVPVTMNKPLVYLRRASWKLLASSSIYLLYKTLKNKSFEIRVELTRFTWLRGLVWCDFVRSPPFQNGS